jgi:ubiquinone/menaquinone biosynthesis C-methylase UbiE
LNLEEMYRWWNEAAKTNAMSAILSNKPAWDTNEFFETGREWLCQHFDWAASAGFSPGGTRALDFGCGMGRMANALAQYYETVLGVDISDEMLRLARENRRTGNIEFAQALGPPIGEPDGSFHLVYSTIAVQHIAPPFNLETISDLFRLCAAGGYVLFDAPSHKQCPTDGDPGAGIFLVPFQAVLKRAQERGLELIALRNFPATSARHYQYLFQKPSPAYDYTTSGSKSDGPGCQ